MRDWERRVHERLEGLRLDESSRARMVEELAAMLEACETDALGAGASEDEARAAAEAQIPEWDALASELERLGSPPRRTGTTRERGGPTVLSGLGKDFAAAFKTLRKHSGFSATVVLTLGLAIGANTTMFSMVDAVLLKPLPYESPDRLVRVFSAHRERPLDRMGVSTGDVVDWRKRNEVFEGIGAWYVMGRTLKTEEAVEVVSVAQVSEDFFSVLAVPPAMGRTFTAEETARATFNSAAAHVGTDPVAVLSHRAWERRFGSDPSILGKTLMLDRQRWRVLGVLPPDFGMPSPDVELWIPWSFEGVRPHDQRYLASVARLRTGVSLEEAEERMNVLAAAMASELPESNEGWGVRLVPLGEELVANARGALVVIFAAVAVVLLVASVNVASLQLVRIGERQREIALRAALGASRVRLARQFLLESALLTLGGGAVALAVAAAGLELGRTKLFDVLPRIGDVALDLRVFGFAAVLTAAASAFFGLVPVAACPGGALSEGLRSGGRTASASPRWERLRRLLVVSEVAMAVVLLAAAGLLARSFARLTAVDPGFRAENVVVLPITLDNHEYDSGAKSRAYYRRLFEELQSVPGVSSVGAVTALPMSPIGPDFDRPVWAEGEVPPPGGSARADVRMATPGYFETLGISLVRGRILSDEDGPESPRVVLVNESLARREWPGQDPVGKRLVIDYSSAGTYPYEVVGVIGDVRFYGLRSIPRPELYIPHAQRSYLIMNVAVRTATAPEGIVGELRRAVLSVDPMQPAYGVLPLGDLVAGSVGRDRFAALLIGGFAAVALVLALLGIFGLLSYHVGRRTQEVGIRAALGASRRELVSMMLSAGLRLALVGLGSGLVVALLSTRWLSTLLFEVSPVDPLTFGAVTLVLGFGALVACYVPARRAAWVDPVLALRQD
jgi:putative ABC transport system permease protein